MLCFTKEQVPLVFPENIWSPSLTDGRPFCCLKKTKRTCYNIVLLNYKFIPSKI